MPVNFETDAVVITSAGGKQCAHLLPLLSKQWKRLRLVVKSESSAKRLSSDYPDAEVHTADLADLPQLPRILQGAKAVYHIGPSFHPHETEIGYNMIEAAKSAGVEHFVYSSVIQTQLRKLLNHDCKRYVEEALMESGLNFTILQPTHFMEMSLSSLRAQMSEEKEMEFAALWNPSVDFSFITLQDLAVAGETVLEEREKHYFSVYALCSTLPMSYNKLCELAGDAIGKKIVAKQVPFEESVERLLKILYGDASVVDSQSRDGLERLILYYNRRGLHGNPNVLEWLIGRKATTFTEMAKKVLQQ